MAPEAALKISQILIETEDYDEALKNLRELTGEYKDTPFEKTAFRKMGVILKEKTRYVEAVDYFRKAIGGQMKEIDAQVQFQIGECFEEAEDLESALDEFLKVTYDYPDSKFWSLRAQLRSAQVFEKMERWEEARNVYSKLAAGDTAEAEYARERLEWIKGKTD